MDERKNQSPDGPQLESQSRLLIELGEPETWLETMLRASRRSASHEASIGNEELSRRWQNLTRGLEYAIAATVNDPIDKDQAPRTDLPPGPSGLDPMDSATQSQNTPQPNNTAA